MAAKFHVEITRTAQNDVIEICDYIAHDSPQAAEKFTNELEKQLDSLEHFPERCALIPETEIFGGQYRHLIYKKYRTIFRISDKTIYVLRVVHSARLLAQSLWE